MTRALKSVNQEGTMDEVETRVRPGRAVRVRPEEQIREGLQRMCDAVWNRGSTRAAFWHIPPDRENDVDFILYDAFRELLMRRAAIEGVREILNRNEFLSNDWPAEDWETVMTLLAEPAPLTDGQSS